MICTHFFVHISEVTKARPGVTANMRGVSGAEVGCVHCGQVRKVWADGTVEIVVAGGTPIDEDHAHTG